jgi:hypothetical protein
MSRPSRAWAMKLDTTRPSFGCMLCRWSDRRTRAGELGRGERWAPGVCDDNCSIWSARARSDRSPSQQPTVLTQTPPFGGSPPIPDLLETPSRRNLTAPAGGLTLPASGLVETRCSLEISRANVSEAGVHIRPPRFRHPHGRQPLLHETERATPTNSRNFIHFHASAICISKLERVGLRPSST